jgi:large subunit ribosomal protein L35
VLREDREEKVKEIEMYRARIAKLEARGKEGVESETDRKQREHKLKSMRKRLEDWKILADINDPLVKKKFEDGMGNSSPPLLPSFLYANVLCSGS